MVILLHQLFLKVENAPAIKGRANKGCVTSVPYIIHKYMTAYMV
jgi:hypothetical protein